MNGKMKSTNNKTSSCNIMYPKTFVVSVKLHSVPVLYILKCICISSYTCCCSL